MTEFLLTIWINTEVHHLLLGFEDWDKIGPSVWLGQAFILSLSMHCWTPGFQTQHKGQLRQCSFSNWSLGGANSRKLCADCCCIKLYILNITFRCILSVCHPPSHQYGTEEQYVDGNAAGEHNICYSTHPEMKVSKYRSKPLLVIVYRDFKIHQIQKTLNFKYWNVKNLNSVQ